MSNSRRGLTARQPLGPKRGRADYGSVEVELDQDLVDLLEALHRPVKQAARELIVLELYRQGEISSGKAAEAAWHGTGRLHPPRFRTRDSILPINA